jgi:hypothetical protein
MNPPNVRVAQEIPCLCHHIEAGKLANVTSGGLHFRASWSLVASVSNLVTSKIGDVNFSEEGFCNVKLFEEELFWAKACKVSPLSSLAAWSLL